MQPDGKQDNPDELTRVSDPGYSASPTSLRLQVLRVEPIGGKDALIRRYAPYCYRGRSAGDAVTGYCLFKY
ncbi:hypothetical protein CU276_02565 [Yersinia kristensenii]|nr:hypothetical protein CU276_02565 [Yersinia kristensenii]